MRELLQAYFDGHLSRRAFFRRLTAVGFTAASAGSLIEAAESGEEEESTEAVGDAFQTKSGTGAELLVEQIRAACTLYIFSNPGSVEA